MTHPYLMSWKGKTELNAYFEENYEIKLKKKEIVGVTANHKLVTMW